MTRLLLDVGNSRLKWQVIDGRVPTAGSVVHGGDPATAFAALPVPASLRGCTAWVADVTGAEHRAGLLRIARQRFDMDLCFATVRAEYGGLKVAYADPSRLGVDRWLQMLALWHEQPGAFVVASAGTALTFDAVDASGQHQGGVIAAGLLTSRLAVLGATRFDVQSTDEAYSDGLGLDTESCVRQGALHSCAGLLERLAARHANEGTRRVIGGGDAPCLISHLQGPWQLRTDLIFAGLEIIARRE